MSGILTTPFRPELAGAFRQLNLDWIERLFAVEPADRKVLDDPQRAIIQPGGMIYFALDGERPVGTVAMILVSPGRYELAKMAVASSHQRRGIGEERGAHQRLDFVERDDRQFLRHSMATFNAGGPPRIDYRDVVITRSQPGVRDYSGGHE